MNIIHTMLSALSSSVYAGDSVVGTVVNPNPYGGLTTPGAGFVGFFSNILRFVFVIAGILALINFFIAGFQYIMAAGDSKKLNSAWDRIWQSLLGLMIVVGSFVFAALIGQLFFGNALFILRPQIYGPN